MLQRSINESPSYLSEWPLTHEKTEAVVLRGSDFSETSRVVTLLTPGRGRVACLAKGARRRNSPLAAVLDTMNHVAVVYQWKDGRAVQAVFEASLIGGYPGIKGDLERNAYAAFPLELALKVSQENAPSEQLYKALVRGLDSLETWHGDARTHACWQALLLLDAAGFAPVTDQCARCGASLAAAGESGTGRAVYVAYDAGLQCAACGGDRRLTAESAVALRELVSSNTACPAITAGPEVFSVLRFFAAHQVETDFRSARVLGEMFG